MEPILIAVCASINRVIKKYLSDKRIGLKLVEKFRLGEKLTEKGIDWMGFDEKERNVCFE